jgi:hypothetical protein
MIMSVLRSMTKRADNGRVQECLVLADWAERSGMNYSTINRYNTWAELVRDLVWIQESNSKK